MKKLSKETAELMSKLKDAVEKEGGECVISIGKGKYLSQAMHGPANGVANKTGVSSVSILIKMLDVVLNVEGEKNEQ